MREAYERQAAADALEVERLDSALSASQRRVAELMRDFLMQRHRHGLAEREAAEALAALRASNAELSARLASSTPPPQQQQRVGSAQSGTGAPRRAAEEALRADKLALATKLHMAGGELQAQAAVHAARTAELEAEARFLRNKLAAVQQR